MCSKLKFLSAILFLSLIISTRQTSALLADDIASAAAANTIQAKHDILRYAWINITSVQPLDESSTAILHRAINAQLVLNPQNLSFDSVQRRNIFNFDEEVRNEMIWSYGRKIAQAMNIDNKNYLDVQFLRSILTAFEYDPGTAFKMFTHGISEMYGTKKRSELAQYLDAISFSNPDSWYLKIDCQLYLYFEYLNRGDIDNDYLLIISYYFRIYKLVQIHELSPERMQHLDNAITFLPSPLQAFILPKTPVCMENKAHGELLSEKMNAANAAKPDICTRLNQNYMTDVGNWVFGYKADLDTKGFLILRASIRNKQSHHYVHRDEADGNKIVASTADEVPETTGWFNMHLKNNNLVFSQSGFLMCTTTANEDWRNVYGLQSPMHIGSEECQWKLVDECPAA